MGMVNPKKLNSLLFFTAQSGTVKLKLQFRHGSVTEMFVKLLVESGSCCDPPAEKVTVALHPESDLDKDRSPMISSWNVNNHFIVVLKRLETHSD